MHFCKLCFVLPHLLHLYVLVFLINWTDFVDNIRALRCKVHEQNLYHGSPNLFRILTELRDLETDVSLVGSRLLSLHEFWRKWNHYQFRI